MLTLSNFYSKSIAHPYLKSKIRLTVEDLSMRSKESREKKLECQRAVGCNLGFYFDLKQWSIHSLNFVAPTPLICYSITTKCNVRVDFYEICFECKFSSSFFFFFIGIRCKFSSSFFLFFFIGISLVNAIVDSGICAWVVQMVNHLNTFLFFSHPWLLHRTHEAHFLKVLDPKLIGILVLFDPFH